MNNYHLISLLFYYFAGRIAQYASYKVSIRITCKQKDKSFDSQSTKMISM